MTPTIKEFFFELEKYEADGTDSMDWAEWARYDIDERIVKKFNIQDWNCLKKNYRNKSDEIKSLICGHIHLNDINSAEIQLQILTEMIKNEKIDVAFESLKQITFGFITSGINYETNGHYSKKELKGVFLSHKGEYLAKKFLSLSLINQVSNIAKECAEVHKNEILEFLNVLNDKDTFANNV